MLIIFFLVHYMPYNTKYYAKVIAIVEMCGKGKSKITISESFSLGSTRTCDLNKL